jgi:hypothetical protein
MLQLILLYKLLVIYAFEFNIDDLWNLPLKKDMTNVLSLSNPRMLFIILFSLCLLQVFAAPTNILSTFLFFCSEVQILMVYKDIVERRTDIIIDIPSQYGKGALSR